MRIGVFADSVWGARSIDALYGLPGVDLIFVASRAHPSDEHVELASRRCGVKLLSFSNVNSDNALAKIRKESCDLLVSMSYDQVFGDQVRKMTPNGVINCHAGLLPFYRGRNVLNWAIINGDVEWGVTVHHVDAGIDTGDIILQRRFPLDPSDNYRTLLSAAYEECPKILVEAVELIRDGASHRTAQKSIDPFGSYCSRRRPGDEWIDWSLSSLRIHNFVRGICSPGPTARTNFAGQEVQVEQTSLLGGAPDYIDICGAVVGVDGEHPIVKTGDSVLRIDQYTASAVLRIGDRLT